MSYKIVLKTYGDDIVLQVFIYMSLSFSTGVIEESFRKGIKEFRLISIVDFIFRIIVLIVHFSYLIFKLDIYTVNIITGIFFIANIIVEVVIFKMTRNIPNENVKIISGVELKEFIKKIHQKKVDAVKIGVKLSNEIYEFMIVLKVSGKGNLVIICLFVSVAISSFIYKFFNKFIFVDIVAVSMLVYMFVNTNSHLIKITCKYEKDVNKRIIVENVGFIIGFSLLFLCEVVFRQKLGYMRASAWMLPILCFIPIMNSKYKIRKRLKMLYIKYNEIQ
ncbi:MAG TPA: hypothetical protein VIK72_18720 [Clostridiaceae bacterium]